MNIFTKQIAALLKIEIEEALKVQNQMECNGVDFSECSTRTFNKEARLAVKEITSSRLTTDQMIEILKANKISECTPEQKAQVMDFAFGEDFLDSEDKGEKKTYQADQFESDFEQLKEDLINQNVVQDADQLNEIFDKLFLENRMI